MKTKDNNLERKELDLTSVIIIIQDYVHFSFRVWYVMIFAGFVIGGWLAYQSKLTPDKFLAELSFVVNEDSGGGASSILGQFGLGVSSSEFNLDKMLVLAESRKLVYDLLLDSMLLEGKKDLFANHLIIQENLATEWKMDAQIDSVYLTSAGPPEVLPRRERKLLQNLYRRLLNPRDEAFFTTEAEQSTSILTFRGSSRNEEISVAIVEGMYKRLSGFYTMESTGPKRETLERLQSKADSLVKELAGKERSLAETRDRGRGLVRLVDRVQEARLQREVGMLTLAYGEILKNQETASFALGSAIPFFQIIDTPLTPLPKLEESWIKSLIVGGFLGAFFVFMVACIVKFIGDMRQRIAQEITEQNTK
jgi:hypothetical protein